MSKWKVQFRADVRLAKAVTHLRNAPTVWITVSPKPVRKVIAERILLSFKVAQPDALVRLVLAS